MSIIYWVHFAEMDSDKDKEESQNVPDDEEAEIDNEEEELDAYEALHLVIKCSFKDL